MMRRKSGDYHPSAIAQTDQRKWNEAYGYHRDNARRWFLVAAGAVVVAGGAVARGWYHDTEPKRVPWIIDRNGPSVMTAHLEASLPDAVRIKGHLTDWIMGMRTVTSDTILQSKLVTRTYAWTDATAIGHQQLDAWYTVNNPYERAKLGTVDIDEVSVVAQSGDGWLIDWKETAYARDIGKIPQTSWWRMSVNVHVRLPETDDEFRTNWDGVFTESFHLISLVKRPGT
jgi:type IV secretory pathway TrbF-like protein